jgi:hypothetical protein
MPDIRREGAELDEDRDDKGLPTDQGGFEDQGGSVASGGGLGQGGLAAEGELRGTGSLDKLAKGANPEVNPRGRAIEDEAGYDELNDLKPKP